LSAATTPEDASPEPVASAEAPAKKAEGGKGKLVLGVLLALGVGAGSYAYVTRHGRERTDDAQIDAEVVSVPSRSAGLVVKVSFVENQHVAKGDVLVELDAAPARARLAQAEAALATAEAASRAAEEDAKIAERNAKGQRSIAKASLSGASYSASQTKEQIVAADARVAAASSALDQAKLELDRMKRLETTGAVPKAQLDLAKSAFDGAQANLDQAKSNAEGVRASVGSAVSRVAEASARLEQASDVDTLIAQAHARAETAKAQVMTAKAARDLADLELSYTVVRAPADGVVSKKAVNAGQMVSAGSAVGMLVPDGTPWVVANFKETQLTAMRVGQPATFSVDTYPGVELHGEVESLSAATGSRFSLLPPDNASGNYTKVVQRVPVRIKLVGAKPDLVLRPGMSVEATVDVRK
jgi:membrane fusion protein (multidrug efflux system)